MSTNGALKAIHDRLLETKPEAAEHDEATCLLCAMEADDIHDSPGGSMPESFSQEDVEAAVAAATGPLQQRLAELDAQVQETETGRAVAEAVATKDTEISQLREQLDAAEASRTALEQKLSEVEQFWTDAIAAGEQAAAFAARRSERVAQAAESGVFTEEYIEKNADRFAAMSDEDFSARLEEWRLIAAQSRDSKLKPSPIPAKTALVASQQDERAGAVSALALIPQWRAEHVDPRDLGGA